MATSENPRRADMKRRDFLLAAAAALPGKNAVGREIVIHSVTGKIRAGELGLTLMHEHILVDFAGADKIGPGRYSRDDAFAAALPHLLEARNKGCRTFVDCTPAYLGRDVALLRRLSEASGLQILTNTGYYAASGNRYIPAHAHTESASELAKRWISEFRNGIEGTGTRPGFIKIGVDRGSLSAIGRKLVQAAALTIKETGLVIASHTGDGIAAMEQIAILEREGVPASSFIWVHAQSEKERDFHFKAAAKGAWLEFDGIARGTAVQHVELVLAAIERGFGPQVLLSMDAGWYHVGEPGGGSYRGYSSLFEDFLPELRKRGASRKIIRDLLEENPRRALLPKTGSGLRV
jgi:predicted metal-dependent phosphotriesterase family hydrolase